MKYFGKLLSRLFFFTMGSVILFFVYSQILPSAQNEQNLLAKTFIYIFTAILGCVGLSSIILAFFTDRLTQRASKERREEGYRRKRKERECSPEELIHKARVSNTVVYLIESIFYLGGAIFSIYFVSIILSSDEVDPLLIIFFSALSGLFLYNLAKPLIKLIAKRKGWKKMSERLASDSDKLEEQLRSRKEKMEQYVSDGILLIANQNGNGDIYNALEDYVDKFVPSHVDGSAQLWQTDRYSFAITFPCGVSRNQLMQMMCQLEHECHNIRLWMPSQFAKSTSGQWTMVTVRVDGVLVAASDDGCQWIVSNYDTDDLLFKSTDSHQISFQPRPDIDFNNAKKKALYY